jgi:hypothetical protein
VLRCSIASGGPTLDGAPSRCQWGSAWTQAYRGVVLSPQFRRVSAIGNCVASN